jgi:hypothetical protein
MLMRSHLIPLLIAGLYAGLLLVPAPSPAQAPPDADAPPPGVDVQARGPVHEAYAEPNRSQAVAGALAGKEPPPPVAETPPQEKPEGENVVWIPGYFAWDAEASDFLWISGFWRAVPPGRSWVPGSWQKADAGFRWVSGYWGVASQEETEYLPPPPDTIDRGPSIPAPADNYNYIPGTWVYQVNRYAWRPGYWLAYRPGWVWVSACYRWTPCGFIYVPGYWDMPLLERGLLFAPVRFAAFVYARPGFIYRPTFCIQPDFLCGALFVSTGCPCYFFGDYFAPRYRTGFTSWVSFRFGGGIGLDLNFCYYRNAYRGYPAWERGLTGLYAGRFAGTIAAPPRTLVQQRTVINNIVVNKTTNVVVNKNINITNIQNVNVLSPVSKVNKVQVTAMSSLAHISPTATRSPAVSREIRVEKLSRDRLAEENRQISRFNTIGQQRKASETRLLARAPLTRTSAPVKVKVDLPHGTPAARVLSHPSTPPAHPKSERRPENRSTTPVHPTTPIRPTNVTPTRPPVTTPTKPLVNTTPTKPVHPTTPPMPSVTNVPTKPMTPTTPSRSGIPDKSGKTDRSGKHERP